MRETPGDSLRKNLEFRRQRFATPALPPLVEVPVLRQLGSAKVAEIPAILHDVSLFAAGATAKLKYRTAAITG